MNQCLKQDKYMCKFILLSHKPNFYNFFLCVDFCDFSFDEAFQGILATGDIAAKLLKM